jgi:AcrR family transcriptional regulator
METKSCQSEPDCKRQAGRPRSEVARKAILDSAFSFLEEKPVADISTIHIAQKAGVSTATVYRWWSTKEALLLEALLFHCGNEVVLAEEGQSLDRLLNYVLQVGRSFMGKNGKVMARILTAIQDNETLRQEFIDQLYAPRNREIRAVVELAVEEGTLPRSLEIQVFKDSIFGPLLVRLLISHEPIDEAYVTAIFNQAVAGSRALAAEALPGV